MKRKVKQIVAGLLDEPTTDALLGVKPLYYYYDVHVNFGDDNGYSAFIETTRPPPPGTKFGDRIHDDYIQQQIVAEAVRQGKVDINDTGEVDYVALVDAEEWSEFNTVRVAEAEDLDPEAYIQGLPPVFNAQELMDAIAVDGDVYCLYSPADKQAFLAWVKEHENLFPDVDKALSVIHLNDSWCTDSDVDMGAFFEKLGFPVTDSTCSRCDGSGEEPGAPIEDDGTFAVCDACHGSGHRLLQCECDNTHQANNTVCQWCWARGRRNWNDPAP